MKLPTSIAAAILCALILAPALLGQSCVTQALGSLEKARTELASGNTEQGRQWIEQAVLECATSSVVLRKVAELYDFLGESDTARSYRERAEAQSRGPLLKLPAASGPTKADGSPAAPAASSCDSLLRDRKGWVREKYAIVVGVSEFRNPTYNLRFAAKDADDFAKVLQDPAIGRFKAGPDHMKVLLNGDATVENIRTAINDIAKSARPEDLVVMYFSSHGTSASSDVAADDAKSGYIVTYETNVTNLYATAFPMEELRRVVEKRIRACRIVMFLDTCFSGDAVAPSAGSKTLSLGIADETKQRIAQGVGRVVIASSRNDQRSWESDRFKNSYFTHFLIEALRARGGFADITSVFTHLQRSVPAAVRKEQMDAHQTPVMWPEGQRLDIVIGTAVD